MAITLNNQVICPVLIGREAEVATLHTLVAQARNGHGQVVLLTGEAGSGKSRLAAETKLQARTQGFRVLQGHCFPQDSNYPYAPLLDLLRTRFALAPPEQARAELGAAARELAPLLPEMALSYPDDEAARPADPEQAKRRLFVTLTHFFLRHATQQPLLVLFEDLHWSDDLSLEFLHHLARAARRHPLLLLVTYRKEESHPALTRVLAQLDRERLTQELLLSLLSRGDVDAMVRAIFDREHPLPGATLDAIYELTEGNPFFIEEILKSLVTSGALFPEDESWEAHPLVELELPRSIQAAVQQRIERLSEAARQLLLLAAVAGTRFDFALLRQITNHDEPTLLALMKELIAAQVIVEESDERFAFRHALTRQAIYSQLLLRERKALHGTIAETMEELFAPALGAYLTELAYHFYEAGAWVQALAYAQRAGERALALYAPRAAIEQFTRALKATHHLEGAPLAYLYRLRGQAYDSLGEFDHARSDYERSLHAAHEAGEGEMEWQAVMDLGFLWAARDYERVGSFFREAVRLAQQLEKPALRAHSLNRLGNWLVNTGQAAEGLQAHQQALDAFQEQHDRVGMAQTHDLLGLALGWTGHSVEAAQHFERAIALFRQLDDKKSLVSTLATTSIMACPLTQDTVVVVLREPEVGERDAIEAAELARRIDWPAGESFAELNRGLLLASLGHFGRGLAHVHRALELALEIEHQQWITGAHNNLAQLYILMLEPDIALRHLDTGLTLAEKLGSAYWLDSLRAFQALAYLLEGQLVQAEATLKAAKPRDHGPRTLSERRVAWVWGELALARGEPELALQSAERLIASTTGALRTQPIPRLLKLKGEALIAMKRPGAALQALEEARRGALERREAPLRWQIDGSLSRAYRLLRRHQEASNALAAARAGIESLAQTIDGAELREHFLHRALASLPEDKPLSRRRAEAALYGGLTAREREVAALIARGKSNREIATQLVIGERTVESHVSNILSKLGFATRAQVAVWVIEVGLEKR